MATVPPILPSTSRALCLDMVSQANSGHLGMPLGCADCMAVLFGQFLRFLPKNPRWINRDRFILSAGHGAPLLYAFLYLSGYDVTLEDLKNLRQFGSKATGHPEFGVTPGVEMTTGPLGQGIGNAVGMALSQKKLAFECNTSEYTIIDNCTVCLCGDGCLQEGVGQESIALAGVWKLDNLILIYDCNSITLDADITVSQAENTRQKFEALGWDVFEADGHNIEAISETLDQCRTLKGKPKVLLLKTIAGYGLSVEGTAKAHGAAGLKDGAEVKRKWGLDGKEAFFIPEETKRFFEKRIAKLQKAYNAWAKTFEAWCEAEPEKALRLAKKTTVDEGFFQSFTGDTKPQATRTCAGELLNAYAQKVSIVLTGSADVFGSVGNYLKNGGDFSATNPIGRNLFFSVREHAMGAILNGIAYDGFYQPSGSAYLVFSDYLKPALRVAALARLPVWYFFSHDSFAVGEDGPTHQPIEQLAGLRAMPNVHVYRPADIDECAACFQCAAEDHEGSSVFALSRQVLPYVSVLSKEEKFEGSLHGGYVLLRETQPLRCILIATGSEVSLALRAAERLGTFVRVVSIPCCELFLEQSDVYKEEVLPKACTRRVAVEAGSTQPWYRFVGLDGFVFGLERFGASAPAEILKEKFGFTSEKFVEKVKETFGF
ncbi:MAG: transketolase [Opitutales bacterium]|nr:transketolase [Opitutales bacterium]